MANITIIPGRIVKKMKPMHGGGQPPLIGMDLLYSFHYLTEAGIPFSRLHDVGGAYGGGRFVDIPNIFRDFEADENDPANYDFTFTDYLLKALIDAGVEPYYRLGITIENQAFIKPYHTFPPKDPEKWARICEHIIRHYTEGWADGFEYKIRYWEIWNEPEVQDKMMWCGTDEAYYNLYTVTAKHLKSCFPHLKIGGYASCGFYAVAPEKVIDPTTHLPGTIPPSDHENNLMHFFYGFFAYIKEHNAPIDFFSWHSYADVSRVAVMDEWLHGELEKLGYGGLETHLNEWNPYPLEYGTAHHSAEVTAMMIALQHGHTDACMIYDMRTNDAPYCPLFDIKTRKPIHAYYALVAFNQLYRLGQQVKSVSDNDRLYALAASDGEHHALLVANLTGERQPLTIEGLDLSRARFYELSDSGTLAWAPNADAIDNNAVFLIEV
ncbi:MAG: hypothetical protein E7463_07815 [Ruminococcaceae bacterium]|nr:hypothetical protein [Oscillospiraceae bacterium]